LQDSPIGINENNPSFSAKKNRNVSFGCIVLTLQSVGGYCHCRRQIKHNIIIDIQDYYLIGDPEIVDALKLTNTQDRPFSFVCCQL